ncbi:MAG: hypothetical protein KF770_05415 [Anaerolineae bacterium]|nr:hypothetical protein [Anaerolineae bacterium]
MLDPGRYFAEAIYFLQYTLAQILWAVARATLSIAVIAESINTWVTDNVGYFVELLVNALSAPLGGMFILALTALGFWYALNNIIPTNRWVDPGKLFTYGLIAFFFFSSPIVVIDMMEELRQSLNAGIDAALIDGAAGDIFDTSMNGTDPGLPGAIPDVNSDGVIGSFDLVSAFMLVANLDELDSSEFPVDFESAYFPFGDPSNINLSDEADQQLAKALASDGIERLLFAWVAIPTAIAEHFLHLALTGVAVFLYTGVPFALLFAFFIYTQAFLGAYLRQFINLLIETLMSVIIAAIMIGLLAAAAQQGIGLYIGASLITLMVLLWRIKSALKLATAAFNLFGGAMLTGGAGGMELANMGKQAVMGTAALAGAALTGGATVAAGGAVLASAAALQADGRAEGAYLGTDPHKTEGRVRQLKTIAGYTLGKSETIRHVIEGAHETRTLARNFRDGQVQPHEPDMLDYLRAGSSMSGFGSSPWLAMRFSPSLRAAYDEIGGHHGGHGVRDGVYDGEGEPVELSHRMNGVEPWRDQPATPHQRAYLRRLGVATPDELTRGQASDWLGQAHRQRDDLADDTRRLSWQQPDAGEPRRAAVPPVAPPVHPTLGHLSSGYPSLGHPSSGHPSSGHPSSGHPSSGHLPSLEQAIHTLTQVLQQFSTATSDPPASRIRGSGHNQRVAGVNGPIPDWLDEGLDAQTAINVGAVPGTEGVLAAPPAITPGAEPLFAMPGDGVIRVQPYQPSRRQIIHDTLQRLTEPNTPAGRAAHQTLLLYTGEHNTQQIRQAISQHTVTAVQEATDATAALAAQYRQQGLSDTAQWAAFQGGSALAALRASVDTPLSDSQLAAVADMVLLAQRHLTRGELVAVIGREVAAGADSERAVMGAIGATVGFGRMTGSVRGVMAGARAMNLSPAELVRLAEMIQDGLRDVVQAELTGRGYRSEMVHDFVGDMAALPGVMVVPQSTAVHPTAVSSQESQEGDKHDKETKDAHRDLLL